MMPVIGYTDRLSAAPGDDVRVMVSCTREAHRADLIRLIHGDIHPDGPGFKALEVPSEIEGSYPGQRQPLIRGSHLEVSRLAIPPGFSLGVWLWPTTPDRGAQGLLGHISWREKGIALILAQDGRLSLWVGGIELVRSAATVPARTWCHATASYDAGTGVATIGHGRRDGRVDFVQAVTAAAATVDAESLAPFWVGAVDAATHFNGKLEAPMVFQRSLSQRELEGLYADPPEQPRGVMASWDFSRDMQTRRVADTSGHGHDGVLVNFPTRAVTGRNWTGHEIDFRLAPHEYAAIHFHDDDLDDARWEPAMTWSVPDGLRSGVYGVRLSSGDAEDIVPVFVRPPRGTVQSPIALLIPTFSYLAYANLHLRSEPKWQEIYRQLGTKVEYPVQPQDIYIVDEQLHSLYDRHTDGSGVCASSWLRPLLTMRPKYGQSEISLSGLAAHQLNADLHLVDWLYEQGYEVDVITDGDLHEEGIDLLRPYQVLVTGTHPEYVSPSMLDALEGYAGGGGRIMYLGGNGFYWVTGLDREEGHTIEVRRWGAATRSWDAAPGEWNLSTLATPGGLWRYRGRAPQRLVGVGFTAQGLGSGHSYRRTAASYDAHYEFVFAGVPPEEEIGNQPALVLDWGAAGFEIDRFDPELGSPETTVVLATATGFSNLYQHVVDELLESDSEQGGDVNPLVRADMVLVEHENGGAVFTPGSITWCSCLSHDNYDNNVSRVTANVLRRFLEG